MTARARVQEVRRRMVILLAARAGGWGAAAALALSAISTFLVGESSALAALGVALIVSASIVWRTNWPREDWRVALWVEERVPDLRYRLVSATDPSCEARWPVLEQSLPSIPWVSLQRSAAWRTLRAPVGTAVILAAIIALLPAARAAGVVPPPGLLASGNPPPRGIGGITVSVTQPTYAGGQSRSMTDPADVSALEGSTVEIEAIAATKVSVSLGDSPVAVTGGEPRWRARMAMPARPSVVRLAAEGGSRLFTLTPYQDSVPALVIRAPTGDTTLRTPVGRVELSAAGRDDIGIVLGGFEYIVSSGAGESFTFKSGMLGIARFTRVREIELQATLDASVLGLRPGDVVHVRAVASDGLVPGGPERGGRWRGASETRVIRVARAGEYDSVVVEGAPPPDIEGALSQRMLLMLTEALTRRQSRLSPDSVRRESRRIAVDQTRLRKRVGAIIFSRMGEGDEGEHSHEDDERLSGPLDAEELLARASEATEDEANRMAEAEGEDSPVIAINRPLLEAYNHMWDAQRALEVAAPARAIPPMRAAIAALQRARAAERIYLRGRPPVVVVDVANVRLSGKDQPQPSPRTPRPGTGDDRLRLAERLSVVSRMLASDPAAAVDSLLLLRIEALPVAPAAATAIGRAAASIRGGAGGTRDILQARRLLLGDVRVHAFGAWSGGGTTP